MLEFIREFLNIILHRKKCWRGVDLLKRLFLENQFLKMEKFGTKSGMQNLKKMKHIEVVAAIIVRGGKILCVKRGRGVYEYVSLKYEFPGGKVEEGEKEEDALRREIREELKLEIEINRHFMTVNHLYPDFEITLHSYLCTLREDSFEIALTEHIDYKWLEGKELFSVEWAPADVAICQSLMQQL